MHTEHHREGYTIIVSNLNGDGTYDEEVQVSNGSNLQLHEKMIIFNRFYCNKNHWKNLFFFGKQINLRRPGKSTYTNLVCLLGYS